MITKACSFKKRSFPALFVIMYFIAGRHYFSLPSINIYGNADLGLETTIFLVALPMTTMLFILSRLSLKKEYTFILFFPFVSLLSAFYGRVINHNESFRVLFELQRSILYLSFLFPVVFIRDVDKVELVMKGITVSALLYIPFLLLQHYFALSGHVFLPGRYLGTDWLGGYPRFIPEADDMLLLVSFFISWRVIHFMKMADFFLLSLIILTIAFTYSRNLWLGFIIGLSIIVWHEKKIHQKRAALIIAGSVIVILVFFMALQDSPISQRLLSRIEPEILSDINKDSSLVWRLLEATEAFDDIRSAPLLGHGLGYKYHSRTIRAFEEVGFYTHDSYLFALIKMGVLGLLSLIVLIYGFFRVSLYVLRQYKSHEFIYAFALSAIAYMAAIASTELFIPRLTYKIQTIITVSVLYGLFVQLKNLSLMSRDKPHNEKKPS